eukprot:3175578-Lingulodinium_polyedra.AAC.1
MREVSQLAVWQKPPMPTGIRQVWGLPCNRIQYLKGQPQSRRRREVIPEVRGGRPRLQPPQR